MVPTDVVENQTDWYVSVLALSSRFDGPEAGLKSCPPEASFSTRSVESF